MKSWTFESTEIAKNFDNHVREQLPWYDMITEAVIYIARNYLTEGNTIVDIGSSTGNLSKKLLPLAKERNAKIIAIEKSIQMIMEMYEMENISVIHDDVTNIEMVEGQVYILFLTLMFIPIDKRENLLNNIYKKIKKGGCIIIVDKICDHSGYFATVMKRLTWHWKMEQKASSIDIVNKEMSLAGVQIPINKECLKNAKEFFRMGEFAGWVIEK